jgi:type II secretory pathway pseudopilin PulG
LSETPDFPNRRVPSSAPATPCLIRARVALTRRVRSSISPRRVARSQGGFLMVELVMTALVVSLIGLGIFLGLEGASHGSGNNRHRSIAGALAQQDQERMRAFKATDLSNYGETRTITVSGVGYTVDSRAVWLSDSSGVLSCTNGSQSANYLRITSSVTWPGMRGIRPIVLQSLISPPAGSLSSTQGTLAVQITNQAGAGLVGLPLNLGSPANLGRTTDSEGCAVFSRVNAGSYNLTFSRSGYVDPGGVNAVTAPASVVASTTSTVTLLYAQAGAIAVSFDTKVGALAPQAAQARATIVSHSNLPAPGRRTFNATPAPQSTITASSLYPFTSGYGVYAGSCANNDPTVYNSNYYASNPGLVTVAPGGSHSVTVRMPAVNILVQKSSLPLANAHVVVTPTATGCTETYPALTTNALGALTAPAFPFGTYSVCADDGDRRVSGNVTNTDPAGSATLTLTVPTSGTRRVCS